MDKILSDSESERSESDGEAMDAALAAALIGTSKRFTKEMAIVRLRPACLMRKVERDRVDKIIKEMSERNDSDMAGVAPSNVFTILREEVKTRKYKEHEELSFLKKALLYLVPSGNVLDYFQDGPNGHGALKNLDKRLGDDFALLKPQSTQYATALLLSSDLFNKGIQLSKRFHLKSVNKKSMLLTLHKGRLWSALSSRDQPGYKESVLRALDEIIALPDSELQMKNCHKLLEETVATNRNVPRCRSIQKKVDEEIPEELEVMRVADQSITQEVDESCQESIAHNESAVKVAYDRCDVTVDQENSRLVDDREDHLDDGQKMNEETANTPDSLQKNKKKRFSTERSWNAEKRLCVAEDSSESEDDTVLPPSPPAEAGDVVCDLMMISSEDHVDNCYDEYSACIKKNSIVLVEGTYNYNELGKCGGLKDTISALMYVETETNSSRNKYTFIVADSCEEHQWIAKLNGRRYQADTDLTEILKQEAKMAAAAAIRRAA